MAQPVELDICLCMQLCVWLLWIGSRTFSRNFYRENFQWNCNLRFQRSITFCEYILNTVFFKIRYCLASFCFYFNICTIIQPYLNTLDMQLSVDIFLTFKSKCFKKIKCSAFLCISCTWLWKKINHCRMDFEIFINWKVLLRFDDTFRFCVTKDRKQRTARALFIVTRMKSIKRLSIGQPSSKFAISELNLGSRFAYHNPS